MTPAPVSLSDVHPREHTALSDTSVPTPPTPRARIWHSGPGWREEKSVAQPRSQAARAWFNDGHALLERSCGMTPASERGRGGQLSRSYHFDICSEVTLGGSVYLTPMSEKRTDIGIRLRFRSWLFQPPSKYNLSESVFPSIKWGEMQLP